MKDRRAQCSVNYQAARPTGRTGADAVCCAAWLIEQHRQLRQKESSLSVSVVDTDSTVALDPPKQRRPLLDDECAGESIG